MSLFDPEPVASPSERVALSSSRTSSLKSIESSTSTPPTVTPRPDDPTPSDSCRSSSPSSNVPTTSIQGSDTGPAPGKYDTSQNQEDAPPQSGSFGSALSTLFNFHRPTISLPKMRFESRDPQTPPSQLASREGALSGDQAPSFDGGKPANGKRTTDERPSSDEQAPKRRIKEVYVYYPDGITGDSDHIDVVASSSLDAEGKIVKRQNLALLGQVKENNERWELARTQAEELISQYQTETSSLREQVESSKENETSVVGELILSKQESVDKSIRIAFLESQFEQQEKNLERITKEYEESLESKLTELESANNEVVELDRERVTLSETIQRHENTIQALQQQTSNNKTTWDRERATLSETIQQHEKDFQSKSTELETANRELTELRQVTRPENVQRDENTIQALQLQMGNNQTTWDRERVTLSETIRRHENTIQALQQQISNDKTTWDRERVTLSETIQRHENTIQALQQQISNDKTTWD
ncbi:hypothetical protein K435DRAFT_879837, partial [Dendrothele bispora CBS 962.96]